MENKNPRDDEYRLPEEENYQIWSDLHEFFQDASDDLFEI